MCKSMIKLFGVVCMVCLSFVTAQATTLVPGSFTSLTGTTALLEPQLEALVLIDENQYFSLSKDYGGMTETITGHVQIRVVRSFADNTIDFYWRVFNDANSNAHIGDLRLGNFIAPEYNANYRTDGAGEVATDQALLFSGGLGYINFIFSDGLRPGKESRFFFLDTTATQYAKTAFFDITRFGQDYASEDFATYAPLFETQVPEPASILLMLLGGMGILGLRKFSSRK